MVWRPEPVRPQTGPSLPEADLANPSDRIQLHLSLVAGLIGLAIAWLLPASPGRWGGLAVLLLAIAYGLWAYFGATGPSFIYVRPQPFGGMAPDGYRYYWIRHRGRRPFADVRISLLDQCRAAAPSPEALNAHFEFPEVGPTLLRGAERQIRWKPLSPEREHLLITIETREGALVEELWIKGVEFRLTVDRMKPGRAGLKRVVAIKSHGYAPAEHPCSVAPEEAEGRQLRLAGVP